MSNPQSRCRVAGSSPEKPFPVLQVTSNPNADGSLTLALPVDAEKAGRCWVIGKAGLLFSYSGGTMGTGTILFESGDSVAPSWTARFSIDVTSAGLGPVPFPIPFKFPAGQDLKVTIKAAGTGVVGKLVLANYWWESDVDPTV